MGRSGPTLTVFAGPAGQAGVAQVEYLLFQVPSLPSGPADATLEEHLAWLKLVCQASLKAQQVPYKDTTWSTTLSRLYDPADTTTRLSLFCCSASTVVTQAQTFTGLPM